MHNWTFQNATTQEYHYLEKLIKKVWAIEDIKVYYAKTIANLNLL